MSNCEFFFTIIAQDSWRRGHLFEQITRGSYLVLVRYVPEYQAWLRQRINDGRVFRCQKSKMPSATASRLLTSRGKEHCASKFTLGHQRLSKNW
jgi:hypothetical protein